MPRLAALVAALALLLVSAATCGGSKPAAEPGDVARGKRPAPPRGVSTPAPEPAPAPDPAPDPVAAPAPAPAPAPDPAPAAARWKTYRTSTQSMGGDIPMLITVDLAARSSAPDAARTQLLQITVDMLEADESGLEERGAGSQLDAAAAAIRDELAPSIGARYVGKLRREGSEQHFLYVAASRDLTDATAALEARFDKHLWLPFAQDDAEWTSYLELLYPSDDER